MQTPEQTGAVARQLTYTGTLLMALAISMRLSLAQSTPLGLTTLYSFGGGADGEVPVAGLVADQNGTLYGTTSAGGNTNCTGPVAGCGTVFALAPPATSGGAWTKTTLYSFLGGTDGANPQAGLVIGNNGAALYGVTLNGGGCSYFGGNCGTVFELAPSAPGGPWIETVLHRFAGGADGLSPQGGLTLGQNGVLYGTTYYGGSSGQGLGSVYELIPPSAPGGTWTETVLYGFAEPGLGYYPVGTLALGSDHALYGVTLYGGSDTQGTVFRLEPPSVSGGTWTESVLHSFLSGADGSRPQAGVVFAPNGALYGTTLDGGSPSGHGTVFELAPPSGTPAGGAWSESILHVFTVFHDGVLPYGSVVSGPTGVLYGTTFEGGHTDSACPKGCGTVFSLEPPAASGGAWTATVLHRFTSQNGDGANPQSSLVFGANQVLYGTTDYGGVNPACSPSGSCGTVFQLMP